MYTVEMEGRYFYLHVHPLHRDCTMGQAAIWQGGIGRGRSAEVESIANGCAALSPSGLFTIENVESWNVHTVDPDADLGAHVHI
jgi:hypothetical protein